jgi:hypothetical protein
MTRLQAETDAANRQRGCKRGVEHFASHIGGRWFVVRDDHGTREVVAS